jgi:transposase
VGACGALVAPLVDALRRYVLAGSKVHANDTPVSVLAPGNGQIKTARLWAYVRDDRNSGSADPPPVRFACTPNRQVLHPQSHLAGWRGVLQADAYAGFNALSTDGNVIEAACGDHARRKITDLHAHRSTPTTTEVLRRAGELCVGAKRQPALELPARKRRDSRVVVSHSVPAADRGVVRQRWLAAPELKRYPWSRW